MAIYRDKFRDWNWLHKGIVILLASLFTTIFLRAIYVIENGAFETTAETTVPYSTAAIWPWVTAMENRLRWESQVVDMSRLSGDMDTVDSTRFLFWMRDGKRWSSLEATRQVLNERLFLTAQESDFDTRQFKVELIPSGECQTTVRLHEIVRDKSYEERFMAIFDIEVYQKRLTISLDALRYWLDLRVKSDQACST